MKNSKSYLGTIFDYAIIAAVGFMLLVGIFQWFTENS